MNEEMVKAYAKKIAEDKVFRGKLEQSKSPEEALQVVKAAGFDFSMDDFQKLMQVVMVAVKKETGEELSDSELEMVAGGKFGDPMQTTIQTFDIPNFMSAAAAL